MTPDSLTDRFEAWRPDMLSLLETLVNIDSGTGLEGGARQIVDIVSPVLRELDMSVEVHPTPIGPQLVAAGNRQPQVLLVGHIDTVFPDGTAKERPFRIDGDRAYGPGVTDMKSGVVNMLYVLKALAEHDELHQHIRVVINCDEETSSIHSRAIIEKEARRCVAAFVFEPSSNVAKLTTERKGVGIVDVKVTGVASHSGSSFADGLSATQELARIVVALHGLNKPDVGYSVNVGLMSGGTARNVVAPSAEATVDLRFTTEEEGNQLLEDVRAVCTPSADGYTVDVDARLTRPPLVRTDAIIQLFNEVKAAGESFGIDFEQSTSGGVSDANLIAAVGTPVIDSFGPIGARVHSDEEYLELDSIVPKGAWAAYAIGRLLARLREEGSSVAASSAADVSASASASASGSAATSLK